MVRSVQATRRLIYNDHRWAREFLSMKNEMRSTVGECQRARSLESHFFGVRPFKPKAICFRFQFQFRSLNFGAPQRSFQWNGFTNPANSTKFVLQSSRLISHRLSSFKRARTSESRLRQRLVQYWIVFRVYWNLVDFKVNQEFLVWMLRWAEISNREISRAVF